LLRAIAFLSLGLPRRNVPFDPGEYTLSEKDNGNYQDHHKGCEWDWEWDLVDGKYFCKHINSPKADPQNDRSDGDSSVSCHKHYPEGNDRRQSLKAKRKQHNNGDDTPKDDFLIHKHLVFFCGFSNQNCTITEHMTGYIIIIT